jgi:hypothetical protein
MKKDPPSRNNVRRDDRADNRRHAMSPIAHVIITRRPPLLLLTPASSYSYSEQLFSSSVSSGKISHARVTTDP